MSNNPNFNDDYHIKQREVVMRIARTQAPQDLRVSVVPQMDDYEGDESLCLTSVTFPPRELRERIRRELIDPLRKLDSSHYYYPTTSLHVTIKNIRTIANPPNFDEQQIDSASSVFESIVPKFCQFTLFLQDLVAFKNSVAIVGYSDRILGDIIQDLDGNLRSAGVADDKQYISDDIFFGSMTICRFRSPPSASFMRRICELSASFNDELRVSVIELIVCNAVCNRDSRWTIGRYRLGR